MASLPNVMHCLHLGCVSSEEEGRTLKTNIILVVKLRADENIDKIHLMMLENWRIGIESIVKDTGVTMDIIQSAVCEHLSTSKLCARWIPKMLTPKTKNTRAMMNTALLTNYNAEPEIFHLRMVIGDDAWVNHHKSKSEFESTERKHAVSPRRKCSRSHATQRNLW